MAFWIWIIIGVVVLYTLSIVAGVFYMYNRFIKKYNLPKNNQPLTKEEENLFISEYYKSQEWLKDKKLEDVYITNDTLKLHAYYLDKKSNKSVILVHGYGSAGKFRFQDAIFYYNENYNILSLDLRAHGNSEGEFISYGKFEAQDLFCWIKWLSERTNNSQIILDGVSMGAATVLNTSAMDLPKNVAFTVSDCSFTTFGDMVKTVMPKFIPLTSFLLMYFGDKFINKHCGFSFAKYGPITNINNVKVPILFIHGEKDKFVSPKMTQALYDNCPTPKTLLKVPEAGHAMSFCFHRDMCNKAIKEYMTKYIK